MRACVRVCVCTFKIFFWPSYGGWGRSPPSPPPLQIRHCRCHCQQQQQQPAGRTWQINAVALRRAPPRGNYRRHHRHLPTRRVRPISSRHVQVTPVSQQRPRDADVNRARMPPVIAASPYRVPKSAAAKGDFGHFRSPSSTRYDTRCYFNVRSKADMSQLSLPHGNDN